jgi:hypothetical protein
VKRVLVYAPHDTWKILLPLGAGLVMLMLAGVAAAQGALDKRTLQPPSPIEKAIDPKSDIRPPPHAVWHRSEDPRPNLYPFMRTAAESGGACSVRISVRNIGDTGVPNEHLVDTPEARDTRTLLKIYWRVDVDPDHIPEDHFWISVLPHHMNLNWPHRLTGERQVYMLAPGQCVEGQLVVDTHGVLLEADEADNTTTPLLCCD